MKRSCGKGEVRPLKERRDPPGLASQPRLHLSTTARENPRETSKRTTYRNLKDNKMIVLSH